MKYQISPSVRSNVVNMSVGGYIVFFILFITFAPLLPNCASTPQKGQGTGVIEIEKVQIPPAPSRIFVIEGRSLDIPYELDYKIGMRIREIDYSFGANLVRQLKAYNLQVYDNLNELEQEKKFFGKVSGTALIIRYSMTDYKLNRMFAGQYSGLGGVTFDFDLEVWEGKQTPLKAGKLRSSSSTNFAGIGESALTDMLNEVAKQIVTIVRFGQIVR